MADATYDAIVVGGGHQGTIIACYLQQAGLSTAIFEKQHEMGGGACGEELPLPGFVQNPCAHFTRFWAHPAYKDFDLYNQGLKYIFPDENEGMVYDDGTAFIGYSVFKVTDPVTGAEEFSNENFKKTYDNIARFSKRDADMYEDIVTRYEKKWRKAFRDYRYSPPTPWGVDNPLEKLTHDSEYGIDPVWSVMNGKQLAYDLFESPELRCLFMRAIPTSSGTFAQDVLGLYLFVHVISLVLSMESASIVVGGTHTITHALQRAFSNMGGKYFVESEVDKIIIENGKATGIRLADGREIAARKCVVSDLGVPQTIQRMLGENLVSERTLHRIKNIDYDRSQIWWGNIAMHELPKYKAAELDPKVGLQPRLYMGPKDPDYAAYRYQADIWTTGRASKMYILAAPDSIYDPARAPDGKHTILVEDFTVPYRWFSEREWIKLKKDIVNEFVNQWQIYAPNMTKDNVIDAFITTPYDVVLRHPDMLEGGWVTGSMFPSQADRFRPIPELSSYRSPIPNVYMCSANQHSAGGIGRGSGYNCFKVIVDDFGLDKIWEKNGREY